MADAPILGVSGKLELDAEVWGAPFNGPLVHECVVAELAARRRGTHATKTRSMVRGGGAKPWRQKGTGRARAGTIRSPLWRTGGKTFAAVPKDYNAKINKKMYKHALRSILSELYRQNRILFVDQLSIDEPKTKLAEKLFLELNIQKTERVLIVTEDLDINLYLATRNLPNK